MSTLDKTLYNIEEVIRGSKNEQFTQNKKESEFFILFKLSMLLTMFVICFLALIPLRLPMTQKIRVGMSYLNCFSAGLFIGMALIHMLIDANVIYNQWCMAHEVSKLQQHATLIGSINKPKEFGGMCIDQKFPLQYLMMAIGYNILLLLDRVIMPKINAKSQKQKFQGEVDHQEVLPKTLNLQKAESSSSCQVLDSQTKHQNEQIEHITSSKLTDQVMNIQTSDLDTQKERKQNTTQIAKNLVPQATVKQIEECYQYNYLSSRQKQKQTKCEEKNSQKSVSDTTGLMVVIGLAFHSLFEGLAFGLMRKFSSIWNLALGIVIHKSAASLALGATLAQSNYSLRTSACYITIFALQAPIGITTAILLHISTSNYSAGSNVNVVNSALISLSAGTFLYIGMTEILSKEFKSIQYDRQKRRVLQKNKWVQYLAVACGGSLVIGIWFLEGTTKQVLSK